MMNMWKWTLILVAMLWPIRNVTAQVVTVVVNEDGSPVEAPSKQSQNLGVDKSKISDTKSHFSDKTDSARYTADDTDLIWSIKLLKRTFEKQKNNFVVSPLSIYFATDLLANGAADDNLQEIMSGILTETADYSIDDINNSLKRYLSKISSAFEINNSIWADDVKSQYLDVVQNMLGADVKSRPDSTKVINQWVEDKTHGRILSLLDVQETVEGTIYLVNTTYFKDDWVVGFDKDVTKEDDFDSFDGQTDKVNMMYKKMSVEYYEDDDMQAIRLPYKNGDTIQIFLPKSDIADFIKNLDAEKLKIPYRYKTVHIYLPRFEIGYTNDKLVEDFQYFGLQAAFDEQRIDLFPKLSNIPHYVAQIVHQANIKLDEEGTVASAATAVGMLKTSAIARPDKNIYFRADKPFVFMIDNGAFIGAYLKGRLD